MGTLLHGPGAPGDFIRFGQWNQLDNTFDLVVDPTCRWARDHENKPEKCAAIGHS